MADGKDERKGILWFVLDESSARALRQAVPPRYKNTFYHHITLAYGVERTDVEQYIARQTTVEAYAVAYNDQTQAVRVHTFNLPDTYGVPHITLSTTPGVKPFASVAMLQGEHEEASLASVLKLTGTIQYEYLDAISD